MSNIADHVGDLPDLVANVAHIRQHLATLTKRWPELDETVQFEIRCLDRVTKSASWKFFDPNKIDQAVEYAVNQNARNNVYVTSNPIRIDRQGKASSTADVAAAFFVFVDADDTSGMENIRSFVGPQPTFTVKTGVTPYTRGHAYWELDDPCRNLKAWVDLQKSMIKSLKTDPAIHNPDRIMRLAGTVSWPDRGKIDRGYVPELTAIKTEFSQHNSSYAFETMFAAFSAMTKPVTGNPNTAGGNLPSKLDFGPQALDRELMKQRALADENWHMSLLKLVHSYVNEGLLDSEIHKQTEPLTLAGYTIQETAADVQKMIKGSRAKISGENKSVPQHKGLMDGTRKNQDCPGPDPLVKTGKGKVPANLHNIFTVLNEFSPWGEVFAYDDFTMRKMIIRKPPNQTGNPSHFRPREIRDTDYAKVTRWLNCNGFLQPTKQVVCDAVNEICELNLLSPVRHYLESLSFDPMTDGPLLSVWMERFLGVLPENEQETDYVRAVSRLSLIQAVARALNPGCKADSVPILEGKQGTGKSTALRILHGTDWFGDALPPMGTKDASDYVRGKWGIELAELAFQAKAEVEAQKAYISRQEERFRPAYGREEITYERRCVFWGTTNRIDYLKDETGNRRFLPIKTGKINITGLKGNRDKLWAEAVYYFQKNECYWLDDHLLPYAKEQAHRRLESDPWTQDVITSLSGMNETTIREALLKCFPQDLDGQGIRSHQITQKMNRRMGNCLIAAGWLHDGKYTSGLNRNQVRYIKFDDASDPAPDDMKNNFFTH